MNYTLVGHIRTGETQLRKFVTSDTFLSYIIVSDFTQFQQHD